MEIRLTQVFKRKLDSRENLYKHLIVVDVIEFNDWLDESISDLRLFSFLVK